MGKFIKPTNCHPLVKELFRIMRNKGVFSAELARISGIERATFTRWKTHNSPNLTNIEACFNSLGYDLVVVKRKEKKDERKTS